MAREAAATTPQDPGGTSRRAHRSRPVRQTRAARMSAVTWLEYIVVALFAFVPQLASQPGVVDSDTKSYLFIDPARFLAQSASMWDPDIALGTVTHQQLGYLFPMGPFFLATHSLGIPVWAAERLWVGATLFAAGAGVIYLAHTLTMRGPGALAAGIAYMLSPYFLQYVGRISVILLSWAALPWLVALVARAMRQGGWRYPALFALVALTAGGVNASSLIYVGVGPLLWLPYAVLVSREQTWRRAWGVLWRTGLLTLAVSLWWIVGLEIEGGYGLDILKYTETVQAVSQTSYASEVLRGLGYWYFYGSDRIGQWVATSSQFTQEIWLIATSFAVPVAAFVSAVVVRWRHRAYFVLLVVVGLVLSVGANPFGNPSPLGALLKWVMTDTTAGLAMRSTDRASPLLLLGTSMLLGAGVSALSAQCAARRSRVGRRGDRSRVRGEPCGVQRDDGRRQFHAAGDASDVPHRRDERVEHATGRDGAGRDAGSRHTRSELRRLQVRRHDRHGVPGTALAAFRAARATGVRVARHSGRSLRDGRPHPGGLFRAERARTDGEPHERRRRPRTERSRVRALQRAHTASGRAGPHPEPGRPRETDRLRDPSAERLAHRRDRRGHRGRVS